MNSKAVLMPDIGFYMGIMVRPLLNNHVEHAHVVFLGSNSLAFGGTQSSEASELPASISTYSEHRYIVCIIVVTKALVWYDIPSKTTHKMIRHSTGMYSSRKIRGRVCGAQTAIILHTFEVHHR